MCVECGCEIPSTEEEEMPGGRRVVDLPAEVAEELDQGGPVATGHPRGSRRVA